MAGVAQGLQRDLEGSRRVAGDLGCRRVGLGLGRSAQGSEDLFGGVRGIAPVDPVALTHEAARCRRRRDFGQTGFDFAFGATMRQGDPQDGKPLGRHVTVGQSTEQRIGGFETPARQREMHPELTRRAGQQERAPDIGHEPDACLGHGQDRAFGDEPMGRMGTEADAAPHGHAVHHAYDRLREAGQSGVEPVLGAKEIRHRGCR